MLKSIQMLMDLVHLPPSIYTSFVDPPFPDLRPQQLMTIDMDWTTETPNTEPSLVTATPSTTESLVDPAKMKVGYFGNEFPHDDLHDLSRRLYNWSKDRQHTLLATFIHEATSAVREEVRLLPATLRALIPPFETIFSLVSHADLRHGPLGGCIDGMLLCAVQLATFIG